MRAKFLVSVWAPVVIWAGLIFFLSSIPSLSTGLGVYDWILRKIAHMVEFGILAIFLLRAFKKTNEEWSLRRAMIFSAIFALLYAISDEIHQAYVPGRTAAFTDVLIDGCGIIVAMLATKSKSQASNSRGINWVLVFGIWILTSCGPQADLNKAKKLEQKGKYEAAWQNYQKLAAENPQSPVAPEALFRAGLMSQRYLNNCHMASAFYERVIENHSQSEPWARAAFLQKQNCPDYFPLLPGSEWVEGDSETKGKNARIQTNCKVLEGAKNNLPSEAAILSKTYFAGDKKSSSIELIYKKIGNELTEFAKAEDAVGRIILTWPLKAGTTWKTRPGNTTFVYEIQSANEKVKVEAGEFQNCLKVQVAVSGITGAASMEYYAPGVGRVLTTVSTKGNEARVTELMSYRLGEWKLP